MRSSFLLVFALLSVSPLVSACASAPSPARPHAHAHAAHRFQDAAAWAREFDAPSRDEWQRPEVVLRMLALAPSARVADVGAGTGYFTVRFARAVPAGHVDAIDVEPDMVQWLRDRAAREGLTNVEAVLAPKDDPKLAPGTDLVFLCDTYHHLAAREEYLRKIAAALAPGGRVVIVDFKGGELPVGPPPGARVLPDVLEQEMSAGGFRRVALDEGSLPYQYIAVYVKR